MEAILGGAPVCPSRIPGAFLRASVSSLGSFGAEMAGSKCGQGDSLWAFGWHKDLPNRNVFK